MCSASAKDLEDGAHENNNNNLPLSESIIFFIAYFYCKKSYTSFLYISSVQAKAQENY